MIKKALLAGSTASLLIMLSGCGGEGSSSGSPSNPTGSVAPSPTPTPTPTPSSPASQYPPAPFGIVDAQQFFLLGWRPSPDGPVLLDNENYRIGWGKSPDTYRVSIPQVQDGRFIYTFPGNNPNAFTVYKPDGTETSVHASLTPSATYNNTIQSIGYVYLFDYAMQIETRIGEGLFGLATPSAKIPANGKRAYRYENFFNSSEPWFVTVDFATGQFSGKLPVFFTDWTGPYPPVFYDIEGGIFDPATGQFTGKFTVPDAQKEGIVHGRLMGPDAGELALAYAGPVFDPYSVAFQQYSFLAPGRYYPAC